MTLFGKSISGLAVLVGCLGMAAGSLSAQQASFTLPVEAHWGRAVLEPGDYKIHFPNPADATPILRVAGNGKTSFILLQVTSKEHREEANGKLLLADINGHYTVESLSVPDQDETFIFPLSKSQEASNNSRDARKSPSIAVQIKKVAR